MAPPTVHRAVSRQPGPVSWTKPVCRAVSRRPGPVSWTKPVHRAMSGGPGPVSWTKPVCRAVSGGPGPVSWTKPVCREVKKFPEQCSNSSWIWVLKRDQCARDLHSLGVVSTVAKVYSTNVGCVSTVANVLCCFTIALRVKLQLWFTRVLCLSLSYSILIHIHLPSCCRKEYTWHGVVPLRLP